MLLLPLFLTALYTAVLLGSMNRRRPSRSDWISVSLSVPAFFLFIYRAADAVVSMLSEFWSFIRLMPAIALYNGYRLYYPDGEGPLLGWSYGPLMPCVQIPIGVLPDPLAAVLAGGILNEIILFLPLLLLFWRVLPESPSRLAVGILLLCALQSLMLYSAPAAFWMRGIQVDTFAMGLALLGFWVLLGANPSGPVSVIRIATAALLLAAAVFSKQNELFVLVVAVAMLWVRDGRRGALGMMLALALAGLLGFSLCLAAVGWEAMFLNLWLVPSRHPRLEPGVGIIALVGLEFLVHASGFLALFVALAQIWLRKVPNPATWREWLFIRPWIVPAAAAFVIFPISVMGKVKVGGADNSNHAVYYLAATIGMMTAGLMKADPHALRNVFPAVALAAALVANLVKGADFRSFQERRQGSLLENEYQFALKHPGEVWFSANPLVTLYTDRKLYHQGYGVYDRTLPNLPPTPRHLREYLPSKLRWVCWPGYTFWKPDGLRRIPPPEGIQYLDWFEVPPQDRR